MKRRDLAAGQTVLYVRQAEVVAVGSHLVTIRLDGSDPTQPRIGYVRPRDLQRPELEADLPKLLDACSEGQ